MPLIATALRTSPVARRARALAAVVALSLLAACSGGGDSTELAAANSSLVRNDPYPNVAADPAKGATAPRSSAEVRTIENRMMSLAAEQSNASRSTAPSGSMVEQMKALAKRNQSMAQGEELPPAEAPQPTN